MRQLSFCFQSPGMLLVAREPTEQVSHFRVQPKLIDCRALKANPGSSWSSHVLPASSLPPCRSNPASSTAAGSSPSLQPARRSCSGMWESDRMRNSNPGIHQWGVSKSVVLVLSVTWRNVEGKRGKNLPPKFHGGEEIEKKPENSDSVIFGRELKLPIQTIWCLSPSQSRAGLSGMWIKSVSSFHRTMELLRLEKTSNPTIKHHQHLHVHH